MCVCGCEGKSFSLQDAIKAKLELDFLLMLSDSFILILLSDKQIGNNCLPTLRMASRVELLSGGEEETEDERNSIVITHKSQTRNGNDT